MSREDVEGAGNWVCLMIGSGCPAKLPTGSRSPGRSGKESELEVVPSWCWKSIQEPL